jgi:hypothetical protein
MDKSPGRGAFLLPPARMPLLASLAAATQPAKLSVFWQFEGLDGDLKRSILFTVKNRH